MRHEARAPQVEGMDREDHLGCPLLLVAPFQGGTRDYMSPEQRSLLATFRRSGSLGDAPPGELLSPQGGSPPGADVGSPGAKVDRSSWENSAGRRQVTPATSDLFQVGLTILEMFGGGMADAVPEAWDATPKERIIDAVAARATLASAASWTPEDLEAWAQSHCDEATADKLRGRFLQLNITGAELLAMDKKRLKAVIFDLNRGSMVAAAKLKRTVRQHFGFRRLPPSLGTMLRRCLAEDVSRRPYSVSEALALLDEGDVPVEAVRGRQVCSSFGEAEISESLGDVVDILVSQNSHGDALAAALSRFGVAESERERDAACQRCCDVLQMLSPDSAPWALEVSAAARRHWKAKMLAGRLPRFADAVWLRGRPQLVSVDLSYQWACDDAALELLLREPLPLLRTLCFRDCTRVRGAVPETIAGCASLEVFDACRCSLTGALPPLPASLRRLDLEANRFESISDLATLSRLEEVYLRRCAGALRLDFLETSSTLVIADVRWTTVVGARPTSLGPSLRRLLTRHARLDCAGLFPESSETSRLRHLDARSCGIAGPCRPVAASCPLLVVLVLSGNALGQAALPLFQGLHCLRELYAEGCGLSGPLPVLRALKALYVGDNAVEVGAAPARLNDGLLEVGVARCGLRGPFPELPSSVTRANLSGNAFDASALPAQWLDLVGLVELDLDGRVDADDPVLLELARRRVSGLPWSDMDYTMVSHFVTKVDVDATEFLRVVDVDAVATCAAQLVRAGAARGSERLDRGSRD